MFVEYILAVGLLQSPSVDLVAHARTTPANVTCASAVPPVANVIGVSYYVDASHHSIPDRDKLAQNERNLAPVRAYLKSVTDAADRAASGDTASAVCGLRYLSAWASENAMMGEVNHQGEYEREWTLSGLSLAYLKIRDTGIANPKAALIDAWLARLARAIEPYYPPGGARNNHAYWAGLAIASAGVADNDRALFDWGISQYKVGIDQIAADGSLPLEMARGARALHYHLFAVEPLVMLAEIGRANGIDLYGMDGGAIHRLADRCVSGILDPSYFAQRGGVPQDIKPEQTLRIDEIAWMEPYAARFPNVTMANVLKRYRPVVYDRFGGNLTELYARATTTHS